MCAYVHRFCDLSKQRMTLCKCWCTSVLSRRQFAILTLACPRKPTGEQAVRADVPAFTATKLEHFMANHAAKPGFPLRMKTMAVLKVAKVEDSFDVSSKENVGHVEANSIHKNDLCIFMYAPIKTRNRNPEGVNKSI